MTRLLSRGRISLLGLFVLCNNVASAFVSPVVTARPLVSSLSETAYDQQDQQSDGISSEIETYLTEAYPSFYNLLMVNAVDVLKELRQPDRAFTIFAPNDLAFEKLGDKRLQQLRDPRNLETTNKIAAFHCVVDADGEVITADAILAPNSNIGGVLTLAGEVPIGPSQSGGFMGLGAKPDGGIVVGSEAKIVQSVNGPGGVVHEVDALVCPNIIWRYMDQLRLPGL